MFEWWKLFYHSVISGKSWNEANRKKDEKKVNYTAYLLEQNGSKWKKKVVINFPLPETILTRVVDSRLVRKSCTDISLQINMMKHDKAICKLTLWEWKNKHYTLVRRLVVLLNNYDISARKFSSEIKFPVCIWVNNMMNSVLKIS